MIAAAVGLPQADLEEMEQEREFESALQQWYSSSGKPLPKYYHKITSLYLFWKEVMAFGGFEAVSDPDLDPSPG